MTLQEAKQILRIEAENTANDEVIQTYINAIPYYVKKATGQEIQEQDNPLNKAAESFIIQYLYYGEQSDINKLERVINNLLIALKYKD